MSSKDYLGEGDLAASRWVKEHKRSADIVHARARSQAQTERFPQSMELVDRVLSKRLFAAGHPDSFAITEVKVTDIPDVLSACFCGADLPMFGIQKTKKNNVADPWRRQPPDLWVSVFGRWKVVFVIDTWDRNKGGFGPPRTYGMRAGSFRKPPLIVPIDNPGLLCICRYPLARCVQAQLVPASQSSRGDVDIIVCTPEAPN